MTSWLLMIIFLITACPGLILLCTVEEIIWVSKEIVYSWKHCCVHVKCSHKRVADDVGQSFRESCIPALWFVAGTTKSSEASDGTVRDKHSWWRVSEMWQCEIMSLKWKHTTEANLIWPGIKFYRTSTVSDDSVWLKCLKTIFLALYLGYNIITTLAMSITCTQFKSLHL